MFRRLTYMMIASVSATGCSGGTASERAGATPDAATTVGGSSPDAGQRADDAGTSPVGLCAACLSNSDCGGEVCGQFGGDSFCAAPCPNGDECAIGTTCTAVTTSSGVHTDLCVPNNDLCGPSSPPPVGVDAGTPKSDGGTPKGDAGTPKPPVDAGSTGSGDSGLPPPTGSVGPDGGTASSLYFTVVGDTRPATIDDTSAYPTAIIDTIYGDMASMTTPPLFSISTGDYQYSTPTGTQATAQIGVYMTARAKYSGTFFPAMGNHECTGYTNSNCGSGNTSGVTNNYTAFLAQMLAPIGKTLPYYVINVDATDGSWTSKFVFVAANAWDSTQSTWLTSVLAKPTTYTFIIRHEAASANTAPGVTPSETIISKYPYTMKIVGHTHTYERSGQQEVIYGNGGAPLTGSGNYGFGLVQQRADHAIQFDMIDYNTVQPDTKFRFAVNPDGTSATP